MHLDANDCTHIGHVSVRSANGSTEEISTALVVGTLAFDNVFLDESAHILPPDCTGHSQNGFKWLKRLIDNVDTSVSKGATPLEKARTKYDIQSSARTFEFYVTPSMAARMPIPGGYTDAGWLLTYLPRPEWDNRCAVMTKNEGNRSELGIAVKRLLCDEHF